MSSKWQSFGSMTNTYVAKNKKVEYTDFFSYLQNSELQFVIYSCNQEDKNGEVMF